MIVPFLLELALAVLAVGDLLDALPVPLIDPLQHPTPRWDPVIEDDESALRDAAVHEQGAVGGEESHHPPAGVVDGAIGLERKCHKSLRLTFPTYNPTRSNVTGL